ncbi:hypothetical protein T484DRAFT_1807276, partial [Baffinella frigidus]
AALLGRINNRHVVHFYESGLSLDGKVFWIVMEKLDGLTLREVLKNFGPLNEVEAIKLDQVLKNFGPLDEVEAIKRDSFVDTASVLNSSGPLDEDKAIKLDQVLKNFGPLDEVEAIKVGLEVCAGLKAIHQLQVIHRDLKVTSCVRDYLDGPANL